MAKTKWNGAQKMDIAQDRREKTRREYAKKADKKRAEKAQPRPTGDGWIRLY